LPRVIITTSNNLLFDQRVNKITLSLEKAGLEVWRSGRNYPAIKPPENRPGRTILLNILFNKGPLFYLFLNIQTFIFLLFNKFDLIWAVDMDTLPAAKTAALLKRKPVIFDGHDFFSELPEIQHNKTVKKAWQLLEKTFLPGCDRYFTVSPGLVELYEKRYNINFRLLRNLPLEKDLTPLPPLDGDPKIILYQGALNVGRGIAQTIESLQFLSEEYRFVVVGTGDCAGELKELTKQLELEDRVNFTGPVPFEELYKHQKGALVGICTYEDLGLNHQYSLPNRLFDYIQAGIPVLTSNFPDMAEIVRNNETGLVIDNLEPQNVANAIKEACENRQLRKKWQETIPRAAKIFTWNNEARQLKDLKNLIK
jgi:glycosyltransferase involved in cell wall biosynthesis